MLAKIETKEDRRIMRSKAMFYGLAAVMILGFFHLGCGSSSQSGDPMATLNGEWEDLKKGNKISINLAADPKTISIADQKVTVAVNKIDGDLFIFDATDAAGKASSLKLVRLWDDNGSTFTLELIHDSGRKKLRKIKTS